MQNLLANLLFTLVVFAPISGFAFTGTLKNIADSGTITIGYRKSQPPMSTIGTDGTPVGYSIDLCRQIVSGVEETIGRSVSVEYLPVTADDRFEALSAGKIDLLCGATTVTLARREKVDFTLLTFVTGGAYLTMKGTQLRNNFENKRFGVVKGTTTAEALKALFEDTGVKAEIILYETTGEGFAALQNSAIDAFCADQIVLIGLVSTDGAPEKFSILPDLFSFEPFALALRRNDADFRLVADRVITGLYRSGAINKIYDAWLADFASSRPSGYEAMLRLNLIPEK